MINISYNNKIMITQNIKYIKEKKIYTCRFWHNKTHGCVEGVTGDLPPPETV